MARIDEGELNNMSIETLQLELEALKNQQKFFDDQLESSNQELYTIQQETIKLTALNFECNEEIEFLSTKEGDENRKLIEQVQLAEEEKRTLQTTYNNTVNKHQQDIANLNQEIIKSEEQLKLLHQIATNNQPNDDYETISELEKESVALYDDIKEYELKIEEKTCANMKLTQSLKNIEEESESLQEKFQYTTEQLQTIEECVQELQAEISLVRAEINTKKSKPLDQESRGNSMFAEVHDRKVKLEKNFSFIKSHYAEMQSEHADLNKQIQSLGIENKRLSEIYMLDMKEEKEEKNNLVHYDEKIVKMKADFLEQKKLFNEKLKCKTKDLSDDEMSLLGNFYTASEDKLLKHMDELLSCWEEKLKVSKETAEVNGEVRNLHFEINQLESQMIKLKAEWNAVCHEKNINPKCECKKESSFGGLGKLQMLLSRKKDIL